MSSQTILKKAPVSLPRLRVIVVKATLIATKMRRYHGSRWNSPAAAAYGVSAISNSHTAASSREKPSGAVCCLYHVKMVSYTKSGGGRRKYIATSCQHMMGTRPVMLWAGCEAHHGCQWSPPYLQWSQTPRKAEPADRAASTHVISALIKEAFCWRWPP